MPTYTVYVREGASVRPRTVEAADAQAALASVTDAPVQAIVRDGVPLLARAVIPLPERLTRRESHLCPALEDRRGVADAIASGVLRGEVGWFGGVSVEARSLVERAMALLRQLILVRGFDRVVALSRRGPLELPGIDIPEGHEIASDVRRLIDPRLAYHYEVVPLAEDGRTVCVAAVDPVALDSGWELAEQVGRPIALMACSRDPWLHAMIAQDLLLRTYPEGYQEEQRQFWRFVSDGDEDLVAFMESSRSDHYAADATDPFEGRGTAVIEVVDSLYAIDAELSTAQLMLTMAAEARADGLRLRLRPDRCFEEYRYQGRWYRHSVRSHRRAAADTFLQIAAACGLPPDALPPSSSTVEVGDRRVTAELSLAEEGEVLTVTWAPR